MSSSFHRSKEWAALVRRVKPRLQREVDAGAPCVNCGRPIWPGQKWAVGHRLDASLYPALRLAEWNLGPTHHGRGKGQACNQSAGGRLGAAKTNARKKRANTGGDLPWN